MFGLGMSEIIFLAILALIVIGPKELPEVARTIGRFLNELKRSTSVLSDELKQQVRIDPLKNAPPKESEQLELVEQAQEKPQEKEEQKPS